MNSPYTISTNKKLLTRQSKLITTEDFEDGIVTMVLDNLHKTADSITKDKGRKPGGLAAIQLDNPVAICLVRGKLRWYHLVNPEITWKSNSWTKRNIETCLSYPGQPFEVIRYNLILVKYLNRRGRTVKRWFVGRTARRAQHEIDHINGIVPTKKQFETGTLYKDKVK